MPRLLKIQSSCLFHHSAAIQCFWSLPFIVCCRNGAGSTQGRCLVGGRYTPFLMTAAISRENKEHTHTHRGFTNDNKTMTKTTTFGIKNGLCETLPFFSPFPLPFLSLSCPFSCLFLYSSFFFSFPFSCPFFFPFMFPFPFLFPSVSFCFLLPFPSLFLSYSLLSLPLLFLFPFLAHVNSLIKV